MIIKKYIFIFFIFAILGIGLGAEAATIELQIGASADDAVNGDNYSSNSLTGSTVIIYSAIATTSSDYNRGGFRFTSVPIPQEATINVAYISLNVVNYDDPNFRIYAENVNDASNFTTGGIKDRPLTAAYTDWIANNIGLGWKNSPSIASVIQEIVNRTGWAPGNDLNILAIPYANNTNRLAVVSYDSNPSNAAKLYIQYTTTGPDTAPPFRYNPSPAAGYVYQMGTTQATIGLSTDESATCRYSSVAATSYSSMANFSTTGGTSHSTLVTGLANGQNYTYYIKCSDALGNENTDDNFTISFSVSSVPLPDTTPPVISSLVATSITSNSAAIAWTTDDLSNSTVNYGLTSSLGQTQSDPNLVTSHSINLTFLSSNTTYYYQVSSCNSDNYCSNSSTLTFTTSAPVASNLTTIGTPIVVGLTRLITVQAPYAGDDDADNSAVFEYKKVGTGNWLGTFPMYVNRTTKIWHGVSYGLETDTNYDIKITFTDNDGVTGSASWQGTKQTKKDGIKPLGTGPVYWIDGTNGNDTTGNGSQLNPWKTISKTVPSLAAGVTVRIKGGIYREQITISPSVNLGSVGNPITFESAPGETVIIDGEFTRRNGFLIGNYGRTIYDVVIRGLTVRNTLGSNIYADYMRYLTVEDSVLEEARFPLSGTTGMPAGLEMRGQYLVFRRNTVTNTGAPLPVYPPLWKSGVQGVMLWENTGGEHSVYGNTFQGDRYDDAISTGPEGRTNSGWVRDSEMYNNTIYTPNDDGWQSEGGVARSVFWNNTVINPRMAGIAIAPIMAGPVYIFDNLVIDTKPTTYAVAVKAGDQSPAKGYIVHNTFYRTDNGPSNYGGGGGWANQEYYNNLIWAREYVLWGLEAIGGSTGLIFNYNSYYSESSSRFIDMKGGYFINGVEKFLNLTSWQTASGQDANSIQANPLLDSNYRPLSNSPAIDKAYYYPQVGDPFSGTAPDIGAFEYDSGAPPPFNFSASASPSSGAITQGQSTTTTVTASLTSGSTQAISFSVSGLPSGVTGSFSPTSCNPTCNSTLTFTTAPTVATGTFPITITGTGGALTRTANYSLTVSQAPVPSFTISSITPLYLFRDRANTISITGSNFNLATNFYLRFVSGGTTISSITAQPQNSSSFNIPITSTQVNTLPVGFYNLRLDRSTDNQSQTYSQQMLVTLLGDVSSQTSGVRDGKVNIYDVSRLLSKWGSTLAADLAEADINAGPSNISQGKIDLYDANKMMANWRP